MTFEIRSNAQRFAIAAICALSAGSVLLGQGTVADYQRAQGLQAMARDLVVNSPGATTFRSQHRSRVAGPVDTPKGYYG